MEKKIELTREFKQRRLQLFLEYKKKELTAFFKAVLYIAVVLVSVGFITYAGWKLIEKISELSDIALLIITLIAITALILICGIIEWLRNNWKDAHNATMDEFLAKKVITCKAKKK